MNLITSDSKRSAKRTTSKPMLSLTDAMSVMAKSPVVAQTRRALEAHRAEHSGYYYACESSPCSQIGIHLRCYAEAAQNEKDVAHKLDQARMAARNLDQQATDEIIEYRARFLVEAASPRNDSSHPVNYLESPSDRIFNLKYPGLDFLGGPHPGSLPAIAATYYKRFYQTDRDPGVLLEFIRDYPGEFECSGWAVSAFGRILLGSPHTGVGEEHARTVFRQYWKKIKQRDRFLSQPQLFVLIVEEQERKRFSTAPHRTHFKQAARWVEGRKDSNATFAAFEKRHTQPCHCMSEIDFLSLKTAVDETVTWSEGKPAIANVLQEYTGIVCGIPSRTLRSWRSQLSRRRIRQHKSKH